MKVDNFSNFKEQDPYIVLGVSPCASRRELKAAYRELVKKYHPDAGGDQKTILALNAAWEVLGDNEMREKFDLYKGSTQSLEKESEQRAWRNAQATVNASVIKDRSNEAESQINFWIKKVYLPIDRLLGKVINPFPKEIRALSADPYDDCLMDTFVQYLDKSRKYIDKVLLIYGSIPVPPSANSSIRAEVMSSR